MRRLLTAFTSVVITLLLIGRTWAAPVEADPAKDYAVFPEVGPWMVCAASFSGPEAPRQAHELIMQLRRQYDYPAWLFNRAEEQRRQQEEQLRIAHTIILGFHETETAPRRTSIQEQCAVLIGGFATMEDAHKALDYFKQLKAKEKAGGDPAGGAQKPSGTQQAPISLLANCFVVRNPTVPLDQTPVREEEQFLKEINEGESYSLLHQCRKPWTLVIKEYQGAAVIQTGATSSSFLDKLGFSKKAGGTLSAAALNAHNMAEALHKFGFPAYVLHTRYSSIVCIGGFNGPDDPEMDRTRRQLASLEFQKVDRLAQPVAFKVPGH